MNIKISDKFWNNKIGFICSDVIPFQYEVLNDHVDDIPKSHCFENFRIAAGINEGKYQGMLFQDSDAGKWLEAAAYSLDIKPNPELEIKIDEIVDVFGKAQQQDGYLNTYYTCCKPGERLTNISHGHELYCAGHLLEGAIAYYQTTGKRKFLDIMIRCIDYLQSVIGPEEKGKRAIYSGHPEIELALYKLYRVTHNKKYLEFMEYLVLKRGGQPSFLTKDPYFGEQYKDKWFDLKYHQAHAPVTAQKEAVGHAVRAVYLYCAMADLAKEIQNNELKEALDSLWNDVTMKKMYITGAIGSDEHGEGFSTSYDLPNDRAYAETCASIGLFFWASRMMSLEQHSKYADVMEKVLYNAGSSGISADGKHYFYVNPLMLIPEEAESRYDLRHVAKQRVAWFGCACCPPNIARFFASLNRYLYYYDEKNLRLYVQLYIGSRLNLSIGGSSITLVETTEYPSDGEVSFEFEGKAASFTLCMRIPEWCDSYTVTVNNRITDLPVANGYVLLDRTWNTGDTIKIIFDMTVKFVFANPRVIADAGRAAIMRGPVVYCLEEVDNGKDLNAIIINKVQRQILLYQDNMLPEYNISLELAGYREKMDAWDNRLYSCIEKQKEEVRLKAIPYFAWGNRGLSEMLVWLRVET